MKKIVIIVLVLAIIIAFLFWKFGPQLKQKNQVPEQVTIVYGSLWEDESLIKPLIVEFEKNNPNIKVTFTKQSSVYYKTRLQAQMQDGGSPDVFRIHNTWLPMFEQFLAPAPSDIFTVADYKQLFYPIAEASFIKGNSIYAAPMEVDGLALYINEGMLNAVGGVPPRDWTQFVDLATKMTVRDSEGRIKTGGAALGTASNVDHWSDILGLMMMQQPKVDLQNIATDIAADVLRFYTGFITDPKKKTWDKDLPPSTEAFTQDRLGFYFAPSWRAHELRQANPNLKFKVVPVPQLSGKQVGWGSFWAEAVSIRSKHPKESWQFIKFLTSPEAEKLLYKNASAVRLFGEPYSLTSLSKEIVDDPIVGAFVAQGPIYKSWYLASNTFDDGINDQMIKYFEDGVNATLAGIDPQTALQTVAKGVTQVLERYIKPTTTLPAQKN